MRFINHSAYDNWTVSVKGENISTIIDKLIRLAAKNTEYYASDIVFTINALQTAADNKVPYTRYLGFRDGGVSAHEGGDDVSLVYCGEVIQWWKLSHEPNHGHDAQTILTRVDLLEWRGDHVS